VDVEAVGRLDGGHLVGCRSGCGDCRYCRAQAAQSTTVMAAKADSAVRTRMVKILP
jgi:hypothetical protein